MRIENEIKLDFSDVLIKPKRSTLSSRKEVDLTRKFKFRNYVPKFPDNISSYHYSGIPIMAANMDAVGTFNMGDKLGSLGLFTCLIKTYSVEELVDYFSGEDFTVTRTEHVAMSIGSSAADLEKLCAVYDKVEDNLRYLCIDVANGYSEHFVEHVREVRYLFPHIVIIAGNVATSEMTEELILAGADIVKVGIGPGSVCTTRVQTGVGYPQLSAVIECADAAHGLGGHIIADGGCTCPGDVAKAFAGGADFVMLGGMLAGHLEGSGRTKATAGKPDNGDLLHREATVITKRYLSNELEFTNGPTHQRKIEEKRFVQFWGMSSESANNLHFGGLKDYRASEGRTVLVPYKNEVANTVQEILGGLRSSCTYAGAKELKHLSKCTTFVRCNSTHNRVFESSTIGK